MKKLLLVALLFPWLAAAQGLPIKGGASADLATVTAAKSLQTQAGASSRVTYIAVATGLVTTAAFNVSVEAGASVGFKISQICVGVSGATAAALVTVNVNRRSTASSGGTAMAVESTTTPAISKMDPDDGSYTGAGRVTATLGTIGPLLDGWGFTVGEIGAGAADPPSQAPHCKVYGLNGEKPPRVLAGVNNGISVTVTAPGSGGLASGSISVMLIAE